MKIRLFKMLTITIFMISTAYAGTPEMKLTLVKIVNQLQALKPLINQAKNEQTANPRYKVHFNSWVGSDGIKHSGLKNDIEEIQKALVAAIQNSDSSPREYGPIKGDYVGSDHV